MFSVDLSTRDFGGHTVVALCGELDAVDTPVVASRLIAAVVARGPSMIVDLAGLKYISAGGLGVLVRVLHWTRAAGGDLLLAAPQHQVRRLLGATGLTGVFSVYPSVEQAVSGTAQVPVRGTRTHRPGCRSWRRPRPSRPRPVSPPGRVR